MLLRNFPKLINAAMSYRESDNVEIAMTSYSDASVYYLSDLQQAFYTYTSTSTYLRAPISTLHLTATKNVSLETNTINTLVLVGSGTTAPTINDTTLADDGIASDLKPIMASCVSSFGSITFSTVYSNGTDTPITVNEVGVLLTGNITSTSGRGGPQYLLTRTVLETPVTLQPNETKNFTVQINLNNMLDTVTNS